MTILLTSLALWAPLCSCWLRINVSGETRHLTFETVYGLVIGSIFSVTGEGQCFMGFNSVIS
jgi:hypothetical protein